MAITTTTPVSEEEYRRLALDGENAKLELFRGQLREKPAVTVRHSRAAIETVGQLLVQLDRGRYRVSLGQARLRVSADTYYVPDVCVIPAAMEQALGDDPYMLDAYSDPVPLVVEVWTPSTGRFDLASKIPDYQERGDREIWFIHPYERTVTIWRRLPNGRYDESLYQAGIVVPDSLPGVEVDLDLDLARNA